MRFVLIPLLLLSATLQAADPVPPATAAQAGLVDVARLAPGIDIDMRYLGSNNFTAAPVPGYHANICYLRAPAAAALARVQHALHGQGYRLQVYDCYRPVQAVQSFVAWAHAPADADAKAAYFPRIDKPDLLNGYISATSGHSRGHTVDLSLLDCRSGECQALDMGTPFDFFDARANLGHPDITPAQQGNRELLQQAMLAEGFEPYAMEWWHFSHPQQREQAEALDVPVR
jgi:zinc D-Ala-D-Ala dipeptidase